MLHFKAQGYYTWAVLNQKNEIVSYAPNYSRNLILSQGLDGIAVRSWADSFVACAIGTGTSAPNSAQTGLDIEAKRTVVYLDLLDANSTTVSGSNVTLRRTFVFPIEGSGTTYTEAGFSYSSVGPGSLFSRVRLPSVIVSSGERLLIQYELVVTVSPTSPTTLTNPVTAVQPTTGVFQYQLLGLKGVNSLGQTYNYDAGAGCNEPSSLARAFLSLDSSAPTTFGSAINRSATTFEANISLSTYVPGSYTIDKVFSVGAKQGIRSTWRSVGLGALTNPAINTGLVHVFENPFNKSQGLLSVSFRYVWSYISSAPPKGTLFYWQNEENLTLRRQNLLLSYFGLSDE